VDLFGPLLANPPGSAILVDFDGTIAPIVIDPAAARPLPEAVDLLHQLAATYRLVAVVSGRPASFLVERLDLASGRSGLIAVGLYGMEQSGPDGSVETLAGESWRSAVAGAAADAEAHAPVGVVVERKGLSVALHWRSTVPESLGSSGDDAGRRVAAVAAGVTMRLGEELAARHGLELRHGRMSVELVPPVGVDKGAAVDHLCQGCDGAIYAGDDRGDLAAFAALDALSGQLYRVKVAVASDEAPPELIDGADVVVNGPSGVVGLLRQLAGSRPDATR
jgi:trehalose 6-phosphate phosphatase